MAKYVVPDPERIPSVEAQQVGDFGVFPALLSSTGRDEAEWKKVIKDNDLPLVIKDISKLPKNAEGTALHAVFEKHEGVDPAENSEEQPPPVGTDEGAPSAGEEG